MGRCIQKHAVSPISTTWMMHARSRCTLYLLTGLLSVVLVGTVTVTAQAQNLSEMEGQVADLFGRSCARVGCHAGSNPQMGMSLEREMFYAHTVAQPSRERPDLNLIHPGNPDSSYLVMKVEGHPEIVGAQMPMTGNKLSETEVATIENWVRALGEADATAREGAPKTATPFVGWKVVNLPTARMVDRGTWLFLIAHRFNPELAAGYEAFYGLDGSGIIYLSMGYAPTNDLLFSLGRSNASDDVELQAKYRFFAQTLDDTRPVSLAAQTALNWITETVGDEDRLRSEAFKLSGQLIVSRELTQGLGVLIAPGILFNPAEGKSDDGPLVTVGLGGRWRFHQNLSLVAEWVPILTGYTRTRTFGNENRFDSWGGGLEIGVGGHVFQIIVTNSVGLATDHYMRGGDLDITEPDLRLGFNIFRLLQF